MVNNQQVAITLSAENWKVIMDFIKYSCQLKGGDWIKWGQGINKTIQSSIDNNIGEVPIKGIKRTAVFSSNLDSVGYDVKTNTLDVQFNDGSVYQYYQVPQKIYVGLMKAESHGQYFQAVIRGAFQCRKLDYEPLQGERYDDGNDYDEDNYDYEAEGRAHLEDLYDMGLTDDDFGGRD